MNYANENAHLIFTVGECSLTAKALQNIRLLRLTSYRQSLPQEESETDMRSEEKQDILALQERISQLEKSLEYERLRVSAYERLIEIVKQEDGIDVLKKDGAKQ